MSGKPAISIVLPTHNGARYLSQSIQSCVEQTFRDWELILVDDASTDETPAIIREWLGRDARLRAIHLTENRKLPGALNTGFDVARGELFTWTSDDNWYRPQALERMQARLAERPDVDVVYGGQDYVDDNGERLYYKPATPLDQLFVDNVVGACFLYRREVQERLGGYDLTQFCVEDYDFWIRAAAQFTLAPLDEPLYFYRFHAASLTWTRRQEILPKITRAVMRHLPEAGWLSDQRRIEACAKHGSAAVQLGIWGDQFQPWLAASGEWLGEAAAIAARQEVHEAILREASMAYWTRDWETFQKYRPYLTNHGDPRAMELVRKARYPAWAYRLRDTVDSMLGRGRPELAPAPDGTQTLQPTTHLAD